MKKYLWKMEDLETQIIKEENKQKDLDEQKIKLEKRKKQIEEQQDKNHQKITALKLKIQRNNRFFKTYNKKYIKKITNLAMPVTAMMLMGSLGIFGGLKVASTLSAIASSVTAGAATSYAVYALFNQIIKRKEKENVQLGEEIAVLEKENANLDEQLQSCNNELIQVNKDVEESLNTSKKLGEKLNFTVSIWNKVMEKQIDKMPINEEPKITESEKLIQEYILKKTKKPEIYEELNKKGA